MFFLPAELAKFSHTEWRTWIRVRMLVPRESVFLFLPDSATVFLVNKVLLHCRVADKMYPVCEN